MVSLTNIRSKKAFGRAIKEIGDHPEYPGAPDAYGFGLATVQGAQPLDLQFARTNVQEHNGSAALLWLAARGSRLAGGIHPGQVQDMADRQSGTFFAYREEDPSAHPNMEALDRLAFKVGKVLDHPFNINESRDAFWYSPFLAWCQDFEAPVADWGDAWLRLTLLSQRKKTPNSMNLDGLFDHLPIIDWTDRTPRLPREENNWEAFGEDKGVAGSLDRIPPMLRYVTPSRVRIADPARVRLGAYVAEGTTVMHEGFINFNAGTLDRFDKDDDNPNVGCMIEGRISAGVIVGDGSDVGGGASSMGTLSGGGKEKITIGEGSLLGANSGIGISLGHNCVVEAGLYVTAGTKLNHYVIGADGRLTGPYVKKASELSGQSNLLYRRDSLSGKVEALPREGAPEVELNSTLHANAA
jgi:2,3,4,5-tetrahydropyridine-2-carboxylate N-succinyltransferase